MKPWTVDQYSHPFLAIDSIALASPVTVAIGANDESFELRCENEDHAQALMTELRSKTSQTGLDTNTWNLSEFSHVLNQLDVLGFVRDASPFPSSDDRKQSISDVVSIYANLVREAGGSQLQEVCSELLHEDVLSNSDIFKSENFYITALKYQFRLWNKTSSIVYAVAISLLKTIRFDKQTFSSSTTDALAIKELIDCLSCVGVMLVRASHIGSRRLLNLSGEYTDLKDRKGINFVLYAERILREQLSSLPQSSYMRLLADPQHHRQLATACYVQEFFINERFVETIAPSLIKRHPRKLKEMLSQYYNEELGHEKFEMQSCERLGISRVDLLNSTPYPMAQVFCDVLTEIAFSTDIGYFLAIMVTEGLIGESSPVNDAIANSKLLPPECNSSSLEHEHLNESLHHQSISRVLFGEIDLVYSGAQKEALQHLLFFAELNFRSWEELASMFSHTSSNLTPFGLGELIDLCQNSRY